MGNEIGETGKKSATGGGGLCYPNESTLLVYFHGSPLTRHAAERWGNGQERLMLASWVFSDLFEPHSRAAQAEAISPQCSGRSYRPRCESSQPT